MENYGRETRVVKLPDDYEGPVTATVVSLRAEPPSASAVLYVHGYLDYYFQYHMGSISQGIAGISMPSTCGNTGVRGCRTNTSTTAAAWRSISRRWMRR